MLKALDDPVHCWYLDGFAPTTNPKMWSGNVFQQMARLSLRNTTFSTFSSAATVKHGLTAVGFNVEKTKRFGKKREMLKGCFKGETFWPPAQTIDRSKRVGIVGASIALAHRLAVLGFVMCVCMKKM